MNKQALKPCPFCGGAGRQSYVGVKHMIFCVSCTTQTKPFVAAGEAIAQWNRREPEAALPCKRGDTIFFVDSVDCYECPNAYSCAGAKIKPVRSKSERKDFDYNLCPIQVVECEVDVVDLISDENGLGVIINDCYEFEIPGDELFFTRGEAEEALKRTEATR